MKDFGKNIKNVKPRIRVQADVRRIEGNEEKPYVGGYRSRSAIITDVPRSPILQRIPDDDEQTTHAIFRIVKKQVIEKLGTSPRFVVTHSTKYKNYWWECVIKFDSLVGSPIKKVGPFTTATDAFDDIMDIWGCTRQDIERIA